jgi:hypothetical protein
VVGLASAFVEVHADVIGVVEPRPTHALDIHPTLPTTTLDPLIVPIIPSIALLEQELPSQPTFLSTSYRPDTDEPTRNLTIDKINDGLP